MKGRLRQRLSDLAKRYRPVIENRSLSRLLFILAGFSFIIGWVGGMFAGSGVFSQLMRDKLALTSTVEHQEKDLKANKLKITQLETNLAVDKQTLAEVANNLTTQSGELAAKDAQLKYYRTLVGDIQEAGKPLVRNVELFNAGPGEVGYRIVVQQGAMDRGKSSEVAMQVAITGNSDNGLVSVPLTEIDPTFPGDADAFKVKYFKRFEGRILLPEAFEPEKIITRTWVKGHKESSTEVQFDWDIQSP